MPVWPQTSALALSVLLPSSPLLCEDLLSGGYNSGSMLDSVDDSTLAAWMAEVDEPALQRTVRRLALAASRADQHLADGELLVSDAARHHSCGAPEITAQIKTMHFGSWQGANRIDTRRYREDLQRRHGSKGAALCAVISGAPH